MNEYYYLDQDQKQCGPYSLFVLKSYSITPETFVWCAGMENWTNAQNVAELQFLFDSSIGAPAPDIIPESETPKMNFFDPTSANDGEPIPPMPKTWMLESICVILLCCWPLGVTSLIQANKVSSLYKAGQYEEAEIASQKAEKWVKWGVVLGFIVTSIYIYTKMHSYLG